MKKVKHGDGSRASFLHDRRNESIKNNVETIKHNIIFSGYPRIGIIGEKGILELEKIIFLLLSIMFIA